MQAYGCGLSDRSTSTKERNVYMIELMQQQAIDFFKLAIEQGEIPRYLYKYTTIENCLRIINDGTLYFADYHTFNDPFECKAIIDTKNTEQEWYKFLRDNGVPQFEAAAVAHNVANNPAEAEKSVEKFILENQDTTGFLCLSAKHDNLLLWAHYAQQHEGCCVKLDLLNDPALFYSIKAIVYDDKYYSYNYLKNHRGALDAICHKSKVWEYEEEYRVLSFNLIGAKPMRPGTVKEVYLGCRIEDKDKATILSSINTTKKQPGIMAYQATTDDRSYKLNFQRI